MVMVERNARVGASRPGCSGGADAHTIRVGSRSRACASPFPPAACAARETLVRHVRSDRLDESASTQYHYVQYPYDVKQN